MTAKEIKCPQCGRLTFYSPDNAYRPFCSERCRLIDLGQWADGTYRVPTQEHAQVDIDHVENESEYNSNLSGGSEDNQDDA